MLNIYIITPFPEIAKSILTQSMLKKAHERERVKYHLINLFDYVKSQERIDDYAYGGARGMIMRAEPILDAFKNIPSKISRVIYPTPDGKLFNHDIALELSKEKSIVFICGHYKGIDQRIRDKIITDEISIGDYVLTNGELPTLIMIDSIIRLIPGVLNKYESAEQDSFFMDLLDGPHYTRPRIFNNMEVPEILLSGNHEKIKKWFLKQRVVKTSKRRKDLLVKYKASRNGDKNE